MAKKPKEEWQIAVRSKLDKAGIGYRELAEEMGESEDCVRQVMSKNNQPFLRDRILKHLNIMEE